MSNFLPGFDDPPPIVHDPLVVAFVAKLRRNNHHPLVRNGRLFINNGSTLTVDDRAAIKACRAGVMALAAPWPEEKVVAADWGPPPKPTSLLQFLGADRLEPVQHADWRPCEPPSLSGIDRLEFDTELTGLKWWEKDVPIGLSCRRPDGTTFYVSWGHAGGNNLSSEAGKRWCQQELRNKHLVTAGGKIDIHSLYAWGVDLEAQGCTVEDVQINAALLDDRRKRFNLDLMAFDFLGKHKTGTELDKTRMASYHAAEVAPYAEMDVTLTGEIREYLDPLLDKEDLRRVWQLENDVIFPVCEMERNGAPIDTELLDKWVKETQKRYEQILWSLYKQTGLQINPDSPQDMEKLFTSLHLPIVRLDSGMMATSDAVLRAVNHPIVNEACFAVKLAGLRSKYLVKWQKALDSHGILRYALHQTRYQKEKGGEGGVGPGRFSSAEIDDGVGTNIQNVIRVGTQREMFGYHADDASHDDDIYIMRRLVIPHEGEWCSADARQIEFRLLVDLGNITRFIERYRENPLLSFHRETLAMMLKQKPDMTYDAQKTYNYAMIYGAKTIQHATRFGDITPEEGQAIRDTGDWKNPKLKRTQDIDKAFKKVLPEAQEQMDRLSNLAKSQGYITDLLGRRTRFDANASNFYVSLNNYLQGTAAEYGKRVMVEVHKYRKDLGLILRYVVHDSIESSLLNRSKLPMYQEILDTQYFPQLKVPILFDVGTGPNWAAAH